MSVQRKPSLWEIKSEYLKLVSSLYNPETGEVDSNVDKKLTELTGTAENKCIAVISWVKSLESEKKQIEFMKQEILDRERAYDNEIERQLDYVEKNMLDMKINEIKCPYFTMKIVENRHSTDIYDEKQVPVEFIKETVKIERKADREAIKERVLNTGQQIPGANVYRKKKLKITVDKL